MTYAFLVLALLFLMPGALMWLVRPDLCWRSVFDRTWWPSILLRGRFLGVPLDELLYGVGSVKPGRP